LTATAYSSGADLVRGHLGESPSGEFEAAYGGAKQSGVGLESGLEGLFTQTKIISTGKAAIAVGQTPVAPGR
jgi:hypothetical protein